LKVGRAHRFDTQPLWADGGKMPTYSHPGVYIEELPGPQPIAAAGTSTAAFAGRTETGTVNEPVMVTSWNDYVGKFGRFIWGAQTPFAVYGFFAQGGSICYVVPAKAAGEQTAKLELEALTLSAASPGTWGNALSIRITNSPPEQPEPSDKAKPVFMIDVLYKVPGTGVASTLSDRLITRYTANNKLEPTTIDGDQYYVLERVSGLTATDLAKEEGSSGPAPVETRINTASLFLRAKVGAGPGTRPDNIIEPKPLSGGYGDSSETPLGISSALEALDTIDGISLLVTADTCMIEDIGKQRDVAKEVLTWCENRPGKDLFAILDMPLGLNVQEANAYKTGGAVGGADGGVALHSSYGAIYYPWIDMLDPATTMNVTVPPSGAMAGTYAGADQAVGPWQTPAGVTYGALNIAAGVERNVTDSEQDLLNPNGVNAIRQMVNYGILAWGGRTLTSDPSLIYISVRRTLTMIEVSVRNGLRWVVFEPNSPKLWGSVTRDVTAFLTTMWQQGALVGTKASDAFWVQCDASNNPPEQQQAGDLIVDIGVALTYPAEFVIIRIRQKTAGSD
jgi:phage tail sheath protein FI